MPQATLIYEKYLITVFAWEYGVLTQIIFHACSNVGYTHWIMYYLVLQRATRPHVQSGKLLDQHTLSWFPAPVFYLNLYVSECNVQHDDTMTGGVFYNSVLDLLIQVPNKHIYILIIPIAQLIKMRFHVSGASLINSSVDYAFCCGIVRM